MAVGSAGPWSVLVLGGTGFRGHPTTQRLVRDGHNVTVLSRGTNYWNILEELRPSVAHWKCNRTLAVGKAGVVLAKPSGLAKCAPLVATSTFFHAVVDFSSRTSQQLKQALELLQGRTSLYIFISTHTVYEVSRARAARGRRELVESDGARPSRGDASPLQRLEARKRNALGDAFLECEEALHQQLAEGGPPFTIFRLGNVFGPKENSMRYWLLHLWARAHQALSLPLHLDEALRQSPLSMTYSLDVAEAVLRVIAKSQGEVCCPEHVQGEVFNLACEETPTQYQLYNHVADAIGLPYIETIDAKHNSSINLFTPLSAGPLSVAKSAGSLKWAPTDLSKAVRSVGRFYERVMLDERTFKTERESMYAKVRRILGKDGARFVDWLRSYYAERRRTELYDEMDEEDEDAIVVARQVTKKRRRRRAKRPRKAAEL